MGKIFKVTGLILLLLIGYISKKVYETKAQTLPIPYELPSPDADEIAQAEEATILLIGDHSSEIIKPALARIMKEASESYKNKLKVYDWTRINEGVHRTYNKVSQLKKIPKIVIYMGGSSEFYEELFNEQSAKDILKNFDIFENKNLKSLLMLSKYFGKLIYRKVQVNVLSSTPVSQRKKLLKLANNYGARAQSYYEVYYKIFNTIFGQLVSFIKFNGSSIITLTTPVKVTNPPQFICENSTSETIIDLQVTLQRAITNNEIKKYFTMSRNLAQGSIGNAKSFYIFAKFNELTGRMKNALFNYRLAQSFDCLQDHSNFVLNQIISKVSKKHGAFFYDFDQMIHQDFGEDFLFLDNFRPQQKYISELEEQLRNKITTLLNY